MTEETKEEVQNHSASSGQALKVDDFDKLASEVGEEEVLIATRIPLASLAEHGYPYYAYPKQGKGPELAQKVADLEKRVAALEETVKKLSSKSEEKHEEANQDGAKAGTQAESPESEHPPAEEPRGEQEEMAQKEGEATEKERTREALSQLHPADLIFLEQTARRRETV